MFDRTKFVNDVLSTYEGNNPQVMVPEVLNALDFKINYAKSKKLRAIVDNRGRVVCKSKKGGVVVKTTKGSTKIRLIINEGLLIGLLKSKNGTITLKPVDNEIMATYYSRETSKLAKKLKLMGKYGVENKFGVTSDGEVKIQTPRDLNEIIAALNTKKSTEKGTKVLAKKQKK